MSSEYRVVYSSDALEIGDYRCGAHRGAKPREETVDHFEIAFVRRGFFAAGPARSRTLLSPMHAFLLRPERSFLIDHPAEGGDDCTVFRFTAEGWNHVPGSLRDAFREIRVLASPAAFVAQRTLLPLIPHTDPLGIEEHAWKTMEALSADLGVRVTPPPSDRMRRAAATAEELLLARASERLPLQEIARSAGVSRFHLSRAFRKVTGVSMHRYQTALRLRAALHRLEQGEADLTSLALDLGFADHSHFTTAFRREFRQPPSLYRRLAARARARL